MIALQENRVDSKCQHGCICAVLEEQQEATLEELKLRAGKSARR